jgi:organic hydroperoxide reductase OsmC/OhrA
VQNKQEAERYSTRLVWTGNRGAGTEGYASYDRNYRVTIAGKPDLGGTASARFRGDPALHNPEDLFISAVSACHMLMYLALCARSGVRVLAYEDDAAGTLILHADGGGRLSEIVLSPVVTLASGADEALALKLHDTAHERCFIANSCSVPIVYTPSLRTATEVA